MIKFKPWTSDQTKQKLAERLQNARDSRKMYEYQWKLNEEILYRSREEVTVNSQGAEDVDVKINYLHKAVKFIHSQLATNPPSATPKPTTNDISDLQAADGASRVLDYGREKYKFQDGVDRASLSCITYGTGFAKTRHNPHKGDIRDFDEKTGEVTLEGEFELTIPSIWNIFVDPDADTWDEVRYVFEEITIPYEQALALWPEKEELLKKYKIPKNSSDTAGDSSNNRIEEVTTHKYDSIKIYEYWEKGLPENGFQGRYCYCGPDGTPLTPVEVNPETFVAPTKKYGKASLPYHILTDIDVPNKVYGKSFVDYGYSIQDKMNKLDRVAIQNARAHAVNRVLVHEDSKVEGDSIDNEQDTVIRWSGGQPPTYMQVAPLPQILPQLLARYQTGIDDTAGLNESMFGKQSRETSGFSMQFAVNQGNLIRHRLFVKYVEFVKSIYTHFLNDFIKFVDVPKAIQTIGKEQAFEVTNLKGADISSGWDLFMEYGATFSLDPSTRQQEIMALMPLFQQAGADTRQLLGQLKLKNVSTIYDYLELPKRRQREYFQEMISTGLYKAPQRREDHQNMLTWAKQYLMSAEYKYLEEEDKALIQRHIDEREEMAAAEQPVAPAAPGGGAAPAAGGGGLDLGALLGGGGAPPTEG